MSSCISLQRKTRGFSKCHFHIMYSNHSCLTGAMEGINHRSLQNPSSRQPPGVLADLVDCSFTPAGYGIKIFSCLSLARGVTGCLVARGRWWVVVERSSAKCDRWVPWNPNDEYWALHIIYVDVGVSEVDIQMELLEVLSILFETFCKNGWSWKSKENNEAVTWDGFPID